MSWGELEQQSSVAAEGIEDPDKEFGFNFKCPGKPRQGFKAANITLAVVWSWREERKQEDHFRPGRELET